MTPSRVTPLVRGSNNNIPSAEGTAGKERIQGKKIRNITEHPSRNRDKTHPNSSFYNIPSLFSPSPLSIAFFFFSFSWES
jgi:hypothetical protein